METKQEYPYKFQSGKYKGRTLEWVCLNDPIYLSRAIKNAFSYRRRNPKAGVNLFQLAIDRLQYKISSLKVEKTCPVCKKENVYYLLIPDSGEIDEKILCCRQDSCKKSATLKRPGNVYSINGFLLIIGYMKKKEAQRVVEIFKTTHAFHSLEQIA